MSHYNVLTTILPEDIVYQIMFFVKIDYAQVIAYHFRKFLKRKIYFIYEMIGFAHFNAKLGLKMTNYHLSYGKKILSAKNVISTLTSCNCCIRHKTNRPNKLNTYNSETQNHTYIYNPNKCKCPCRHMSRFICKEAIE
jgi:hypothetical protein